MPKVSVVIPTYNRAHLLTECIESALAQTFRDFEIIIIDDGSTDNTSQVVSAFPVRYIHQQNQGVSVARNKGIELSRGEYIAFLDSDDTLLKNALEEGVEVLDKNPDVGFSYGQMYIMDEKGHILGLQKAPLKHSCVRRGIEELREYLITGNHFPSSIVIRRRCLDEVGTFDPSFTSGCEDIDLLIRLVKKYAVAYIAEPLVKYRYNSQQFSFTTKLKVADWEKSKSRILQNIFNDAELGAIFSRLKPNAYFNLYFTLASRAYEGREMNIARDYLLKALKIRPKGFFKSLWLRWILWFIKTWIPLPILASARSIKRRVMIASLKGVSQGAVVS
jgi:glycosyltransferase involved in cell wall biosynthesis